MKSEIYSHVLSTRQVFVYYTHDLYVSFFFIFDVILRELDVDKICDILFSLLIRSFSLTMAIRDYLDFVIF